MLCDSELDWIGMMTYDFNGAWDDVTGHNSPLYPRENDHNPLYNVVSNLSFSTVEFSWIQFNTLSNFVCSY